MDWGAVFGADWFWIAAAILWARGVGTAYGVPRKLIFQAMAEPAAAEMARDLAIWRLTLGRRFSVGLSALRWPAFGAVGVYCLLGAWQGDALGPALFAVLGPTLAVDVANEPRILRVAQESRGDAAPFADALEQSWRLRVAATAVSVALTLTASALLRPA